MKNAIGKVQSDLKNTIKFEVMIKIGFWGQNFT